MRSNLFQIRPIVDFDSPVRSAIAARVQWLSAPGLVRRVATTTSSIWSGWIDGGRPGRGSSCRPSRRWAMNRARQRSTVDSSIPSSAAACRLVPPSAQRSTIFERSARNWAVFARRAQRVSWARSSSARTRSALGRPIRQASSSPATPSAAKRRRHFATVLTATPRDRAAPMFDRPSAHASTIRARSARRRSGDCARALSSVRSSWDRTTGTAEGPGQGRSTG
ncbi:hypothetical protein SMICM17S_10153 [Streptomyces microflavus]